MTTLAFKEATNSPSPESQQYHYSFFYGQLSFSPSPYFATLGTCAPNSYWLGSGFRPRFRDDNVVFVFMTSATNTTSNRSNSE